MNMYMGMILKIYWCSYPCTGTKLNMIRNFLNMFYKIIIFLPILGVYELATFQMKPGGPALWGDPFKRAVHTHVNRGYTKLVGVFHAEYGVLNRGTVVHFFHEIAKYIGDPH